MCAFSDLSSKRENRCGSQDEISDRSPDRSADVNFDISRAYCSNSGFPLRRSYHSRLKMKWWGRSKILSNSSTESPNARLKNVGLPLTTPCVACKISCRDRSWYRLHFSPMWDLSGRFVGWYRIGKDQIRIPSSSLRATFSRMRSNRSRGESWKLYSM